MHRRTTPVVLAILAIAPLFQISGAPRAAAAKPALAAICGISMPKAGGHALAFALK